ncbi:MAG: phytanoyl-CoA dioxygenase family protein [Armatimonadota bacterium]
MGHRRLPTPDEVAFFRREGWLAIRDFWSGAEVAAMRRELDRLGAAGLLRNVATDGDGATPSSTASNLQLCPMWPHSRVFQTMPYAHGVGSAVESLIGGPVLLHLDQVFVKPGGTGIGTNWHQDNAYFGIPDPLAGTALWTAVHDATEENGAMRVIPRRFTEALDHARDPWSDHHIRCWPDDSEAVLVELPAGGALFFAYGTPHATGANRTDSARAGVALHFLRADQTEDARGGFSEDRRPVVSGAGADGGRLVHGEDLRGRWETLVASGGD